MKIIAHRGLMMGPNPEYENQPDTIDEAISHGFDAEVDVWNISGRLMLGHDKPQYDTEHWMFNTDKIWWHWRVTLNFLISWIEIFVAR